jgi:subtilisin family serine protease
VRSIGRLSIPLACLMIASATFSTLPAVAQVPPQEPGPPRPLPRPQIGKRADSRFDKSTVLVRFRQGTSPAGRERAAQNHGLQLGDQVRRTEFFVLRTQGQGPRRAIRELRSDPAVAEAQLNYLRRAHRTPNDPLYLDFQEKYLSNARFPQAWDVTLGSSNTSVAVVDTGVDLAHPDLEGARLKPGYDFVNDDDDPQDDNGHGTFVAGAAAAITNNSEGVAGAAWRGGIIPVKVLDSLGLGTDADIAAGITWAADHAAEVINLSLGGPDTSQVLEDAVSYALSQDVVVVASAGNDGTSLPIYPAAYEGVMAVSATDRSGTFAYFSNYGWWVDISAPGMLITSTYWYLGDHIYATGHGTSFAAPLVSGAALLVRYKNPAWTQADVVDEFLTRSQDRGPAGIDPFYGRGWLDAYAVLGGAEKSPAAVPAQDSLEPDGTLNRANNLTSSTSAPTISPEGDEDWYKTTVDSTGSITYMVTPPGPDLEGDRAREMDPVLEVYGPDYTLLGTMDETFLGEEETITVPVEETGTYYLKVANYHGCRSSGTYTVDVTTSTDPAPPLLARPEEYEIPAYALGLETADVTDDGLNDVVVATGYYQGPDSFKLYVYAQQLDGALGDPSVLPLDGSQFTDPAWLAVGDLNVDGKADAAVGVASGVDLFYQSGGELSGPTLIPLTEEPIDLEIGDMDGDGRNDIVVATLSSTIFLHNTESGFIPSTIISEPAWPSMSLTDMSADGLLDVVSLSGYPGADVNIFVQQGNGSYVKTTYSVGKEADWMDVGDVTGDGLMDAVLISDQGGWWVAVMAQDQSGGLTSAALYTVQPNGGMVLAADLTGDGRNDVVVLHAGYPMSILVQKEDGTLGPEALYDVSFEFGGVSMTAGDVSNDGATDLVIAGDDTSDVGMEFRVYKQIPFSGDPVWVRNTSPADFATGVSRTRDATVTFGRSIDPASITAATAYVKNGNTWNTATITLVYDEVTNKLTFDRTNNYSKNTPYVVFVDGVSDMDGNVMPTFAFRFTTGTT